MKHLPLTTLFQSPTISQLADAIIAGGLSNEWATLVVIQSPNAATASSTRLPFFCVHGFGGGVIGYAGLAHRLGAAQAFYGLQPVGLDGIAAPDTDMAVMATRYIKAMRAVQPHGPYQLGGYCFGANVAYEMACQLEAQGECVALVAIIEGYAPAGSRSRPSTRQWSRLTNLWRNAPFWVQDYLQLGLGDIRRRMQYRITKGAKTALRRLGISARADLGKYIGKDQSEIPSWQDKIMQAQLRALSQYTPKRYGGRVTVFRAQHQTISQALFDGYDPELGWGQLALGGVDARQCPGSHRNLHMEPYVAGLAEQLSACLDEVMEQHRS